MIYVIYTKYDLKKGENKYHKEHEIGLSLLKYALINKYKLPLNKKTIHFTYNDNGKPFLKDYDIHFNISHCNHYVVVALNDHPIGIDVERVATSSYTMRKKVLSSDELAHCHSEKSFFKYWTLKESYMKWCGKGFALDPKTITFQFLDNKIISSDPSVYHYQIYLDDDCLLALTYETEETIHIESYEDRTSSELSY